MDLTVQYLMHKFKRITREEIISIVDSYINNGITSDELIDLSLSANVDPYEFEKRMIPFVDFSSVDHQMIKLVVISAMKFPIIEVPDQLICGLNWLLYDMSLISANDEIGQLYYQLDHVGDMICDKYCDISEFNKVCLEFVKNAT